MNLNMKWRVVILIAVILVTGSAGVVIMQANAAKKITKAKFKKGKCIGTEVNIQSKPSVKATKVGTLYKGQKVKVMYKASNWYAIRTKDTCLVGYVSGNYLKKSKKSKKKADSAGNKQKSGSEGNISGSNNGNSMQDNVNLSADERDILNLVNAERTAGGLGILTPDTKTMAAARAKAEDMVTKNYFSHQSPTYGSPFDMMKQFGVSYKTAAENLAGNSDNNAAVKAWMNSSGHRANIMNGSYNFTGIGVVKSGVYGKIYVQMFVGR